MKQITDVLILPFLIFITFTGCSEYKSPSVATLYQDYQAGRDIKNEKYEEALAKYYSLLSEDTERESTHSNIGVLLSMVQKPEEALKSLQYALKLAEGNNKESSNQEMIFKVHYNLGVYFGALKKIPEALAHYQSALDIIPNSNEIKTNIELLLQQQKQDQKQQGDQGEPKNDQQSKNDNNKKNDQNKDDQNQGDQNKDEENKDEENKDEQGDKNDQKKSASPKYQPRPYKGDQLTEGDVKKILGELKNQEQKIRANFDKKEKKGKTKNNEKDW